MSLQGHTARREHKVSVGSKGSVVQWFGGSEEVSTTKYGQKMRGISVDCKIRTKTKLRSTTDTKAILIVESPQLIVNTYTQLRHYESYRRNWKVREQ